MVRLFHCCKGEMEIMLFTHALHDLLEKHLFFAVTAYFFPHPVLWDGTLSLQSLVLALLSDSDVQFPEWQIRSRHWELTFLSRPKVTQSITDSNRCKWYSNKWDLLIQSSGEKAVNAYLWIHLLTRKEFLKNKYFELQLVTFILGVHLIGTLKLEFHSC